MRSRGVLVLAAAVCLCSLPAGAATLYSDLGTVPGSLYSSSGGTNIAGSGNPVFSQQSLAALFTAAGSGSQTVTQIDLAVASLFVPNTFAASIWTDNGGIPGSEVANAYWSLTTNIAPFTCCNFVTVSGISGVTLTGGTSYFMVLAPLSATDTSGSIWADNNVGLYSGLVSLNGGATWISSPFLAGAFDVLGGSSVPEPSSVLLVGMGLMGLLLSLGRRASRK